MNIEKERDEVNVADASEISYGDWQKIGRTLLEHIDEQAEQGATRRGAVACH